MLYIDKNGKLVHVTIIAPEVVELEFDSSTIKYVISQHTLVDLIHNNELKRA